MINAKKIAIYAKNKIDEKLEYKKLESYGFEIIEFEDENEFIDVDIRLKIIYNDISHNKCVDIINSIRRKFTKIQVGIIICLEKERINYLLDYINLGINDYIKLPSTHNELYVILTKTLKALDEDSKFQVTIDNLPFPIWVNDLSGKYINANHKFAELLNTTVDKIIGKLPKEYYDINDVEKFEIQNNDVLKHNKTIKFDDYYIEKGKKRTVEVYKTPLLNTYNEIVGITGSIIDITELKDAKEEAKNQALTDALTLVSNRRGLYEYMKQIKDEDIISVMLIDLDNFKFVNDTYGHSAGDNILIDFAKRLREICKNSFICRLGGDEFLVVYKNIDNLNIIYEQAKKLIDQEQIGHLGLSNYHVSVSIGIVVNQKKDNLNVTLVRADLAMYKAKELGKNNYVVYSYEIGKKRLKKHEIETSIRNSNEIENLKLYYQPQYSKDNKIKGVEGLLRWENDKYKDIPISYIIKIMEESDLIINIGYHIIKETFKFAKKINENRQRPLIVSVNISAIQIMDKNFIYDIKRALAETGVNPKYIGIELTETSLLKDMEKNAMKIQELRNMGMSILIDDFGIGYSSISYILGLPVTTIKIDKSLIDLVHIEEKYANVVRLIVSFAKVSNLKVVAEGVEEEVQLEILKEMGVDYFQGYLFSKPLIEDEIIKLISSSDS